MRHGPVARAVAAVAAAAVVLLAAGRSRAHAPGVSSGEYVLSGAEVRAEIVFASREIAAAVGAAGGDRGPGGRLADVDVARARVEEFVVRRSTVRGDGRPCEGALVEAREAEEDGFVVRARWRCAETPGASTVDLGWIDALAPGHRHLARARREPAGAAFESVLHRGSTSLGIPASGAAAAPSGGVVARMTWMGVEHILTGADHLLFLLGLLLVGGRARALAAVVTAFTIGHSATLAVAALGVFAPSARWVEPAIALSILYVGVENWFVRDASRRWRITLPFGLVHGFGFAGALAQVGLPRDRLVAALVSFNVGVEIGQLAVLAVALPAIVWARRKPWFARSGVRILSAAVAAAGAAWFVERVAV